MEAFFFMVIGLIIGAIMIKLIFVFDAKLAKRDKKIKYLQAALRENGMQSEIMRINKLLGE